MAQLVAESDAWSPELRAALDGGRASGAALIEVYLARRDDRAAPEAARGEWDTRIATVSKAFETEHGDIERSFIASRIRAGLLLTGHDECILVFDEAITEETADFVALLAEIERLAYVAWHRLSNYDRRLCVRLLFSVGALLLRHLDEGRTVPREGPASDYAGNATLGMLRSRIDEARQFLDLGTSRTIALRYVEGIVQGLLIVVAALVGVGVCLALTNGADTHVSRALGAGAAGAAGATVSVLSRVTLASFREALPPLVTAATLGYHQARFSIRFVAALRPFMGAAYGAAAYAVAASSVRPGSGDPAEQTFLYLALAFAAGFAERLATDPVFRSGQRRPPADAPDKS